jgi:ankyrin repeat protein
MLTENTFHHHNNASAIPLRRAHYAPYPHMNHTVKSTSIDTSSNELPPLKFDLHQAVRNNDVSGILLLHGCLRQQPLTADNCLLDDHGHTPLYTAIANDRLIMVDLLLRLGHNPVSI